MDYIFEFVLRLIGGAIDYFLSGEPGGSITFEDVKDEPDITEYVHISISFEMVKTFLERYPKRKIRILEEDCTETRIVALVYRHRKQSFFASIHDVDARTVQLIMYRRLPFPSARRFGLHQEFRPLKHWLHSLRSEEE